jgi:NAD(P)H-hydrate repair Nnr-like enzyme with NAD(P)H-hydrate epimerase domain
VQTYTAAQVREAEAPFLERGVSLMARAAAALANEAEALLDEHRRGVVGARVLVLAGSGNNGGDALYAAEALAARGAEVSVLPTSARLHQGPWRRPSRPAPPFDPGTSRRRPSASWRRQPI